MILNALEISTAHITEDTARWLEEQAGSDCPELIIYNKKDFGWFISVPSFSDGTFTIDTIPSDLLFLLGVATGSQSRWLMLDCDADIYQDLPQYEW